MKIFFWFNCVKIKLFFEYEKKQSIANWKLIINLMFLKIIIKNTIFSLLQINNLFIFYCQSNTYLKNKFHNFNL